jgi:predicted unusual protein kinase regulating ubiquinone biosynthesis (AarF/ABC1/UbiB family)
MATSTPPRRGVVRAARLTGMAAVMVGRSAGAKVRIWRGADPERVREATSRANAQTMRQTLGSLKGGAQKAGQLLSTVDSLLPAGDWQDAMIALQESAQPLPFHEVVDVLVEQWGPRWRERFSEFSETPVAAASLGQVHRARTVQGVDVAVKIQYPGVADAMRADLTGLGWALGAAALVSPGMAAAPIVHELRTRVSGELDYRQEAAAQRRFASAFADDEDFLIPAVIDAGERVLVSEWVEGIPLAVVADSGDVEQRNLVGQRFERFALCGPARAGLLHADPHPGNFRVHADGRLVVFDFGAVVPMPGGLPESFGHLIAAMRSDDPDEVYTRLVRAGLVRAGAKVDVLALMDFLGPFSDPSRHESFTFSPQWLRAQFAREHDPRNPDYAVALQLTIPPEQLMTHRVWLGVVGVLSRLNATVAVLPELRRWLPGLE